MLSMRLFSRSTVPQYAATRRLHTSTIFFDSSSSSSNSDKPKKKKPMKAKPVMSKEEKLLSRQETSDRLNNLLGQMIAHPKGSKSTKMLNLAVAPKKGKREKPIKDRPYEVQLEEAAKNVATSLGGDTSKTKSELLNKLLSIESEKTNGKTADQPQPSKIDKDFVAGMSIECDDKPQTPVSLRKEKSYTSETRSARVKAMAKQFQSLTFTSKTRRSEEPQKYVSRPAESGNLYAGTPMNVFSATFSSDRLVDFPKLNTWDTLQKKELKLAITHPPENIFEEMIMWTEQGKLWKFPIDNEQGLEEEQSIHFSEHVFIERHLKDWCPKRGPIRHFMQLVCVGLSKNPYMTVCEKQEHIAWYRDYFASKQDLLKEIGAIETSIPTPEQITA